MAFPTLHLRAETKPLEHRSCLTPTTTRQLLDAGYPVNVERSTLRIFADSEFSDIGATLVPEGSWPSAPTDHIIVGLKELPEETFPLAHTHVQFAHCYKGQGGWADVLARFPRGGGTLLDLEFLQDASGRRVAAFGFHAGFAGAALAVQTWAHQLLHRGEVGLPGVKPFANEALLVADVKKALQKGEKRAGKTPRCFVMGALGRCGRGAVDLLQKVGVPDDLIVKWDMQETAKKLGPYPEIIESDIFVNCIYLSDPIPPFIDPKSLESPSRSLSVVCDVSCDTTNPHNPIPIYTVNTTFSEPTVPVELKGDGPPLSVISIDHLPSLLPREASEAFSSALLPSLMTLRDRKSTPVWQQAQKLFDDKVATLPKDKASNGA